MNKRLLGWVVGGAVLLGGASKVMGDAWEEQHEAGRAAYEQGDYGEAEKRWVTAIREARDNRAAKTLFELSRLYMQEHRYDRAAGVYKMLFDAIGTPLPEDSMVASLAGNYGLALFNLRRHEEAEGWYLKALAIQEKTAGPASGEVASVCNNLGQLYTAQRKFERAEALYEKSLEINRRLKGDGSAVVATAMNNLGELYRIQGKLERAEPLIKAALEIDRRIRPESWETAADLNNLGLVYMGQKQPAKAAALFEEAEEVLRMRFGPAFHGLGDVYMNLSTAYRAQKKFEDAIVVEKKALVTVERLLGVKHPIYARGLTSVAELYAVQGKFAEAEPYFKQGIALMLRSAGPEDPAVSKAIEAYADLLKRTNRGEQVEALYSQAKEIRAKQERVGTARAE